MGNSLQDALLKAGLKPGKGDNKRRKKSGGAAQPKAIEKHHQQRNFCESCKKTAPDVEFYQHNIPSVKARWLCIICADKYSISDDARKTNQSDFAMRGTFRRRYGRTKKF
jgi:hypothetical protein